MENKIFNHENIGELVKLFKEADEDEGGGLDIEEFSNLMKNLNNNMSEEDLLVLHMQIDTNCDGTVDLGELLDFFLAKGECEQLLHNDKPFPRPIKKIHVDHYKNIVKVLFRPDEEDKERGEQFLSSKKRIRTYQKGQYLSISSDGFLNCWNESFDDHRIIPLHQMVQVLPYSHKSKMYVTDMVYIKELKQVVVSTIGRELLFFDCCETPELCQMCYSIIIEEGTVSAMNYWSNGTKAVFSFAVKGNLFVCISHSIDNGLLWPKAKEKVSLKDYDTFYMSSLLKKTSDVYQCFKVPIFTDICSRIRYFPSLSSFAVCGRSSMKMVIATLPKAPSTTFNKINFKSSESEACFTCVEYCPSTGNLYAGGIDGVLRVFDPNTTTCISKLVAHVRPITNLVYNHEDDILVSLSDDKNVCVWSGENLQCKQRFTVDMDKAKLSAMCYNVYNNELVLANTDMGVYLGRGTDLFRDTSTSHDKPLCGVIYHSIYKQVISVCQNGVVTVWDISTGKALIQFKVTEGKCVGEITFSLDGNGRRLLTAQDRKMKLWNFNNGSELSVHPAVLPKEVTCIVCIDDRVFVSGRNSKKIFNLDVDGHDNRFLEHDYLPDISSMDVHERTLITAASNGNVVLWDVDTSSVRYWLNGSKSPRIHFAFTKDQGQTGELRVKKSEQNDKSAGSKSLTASEKTLNSHLTLSLKSREASIEKATLLTSADGYIYAWTATYKGGLLAKFRAVQDKEAVITTWSTDPSEQTLLTGDSTGRICLWDIQGFGVKAKVNKDPFEDINGWPVSLCPPPLLGSWQAYLGSVAGIQCDPTCENIITVGLDCNVKLWKNTGHCIGVFGKDEWDATQPNLVNSVVQEKTAKSAIPKTDELEAYLDDTFGPIKPGTDERLIKRFPEFEWVYGNTPTASRNLPEEELERDCRWLLNYKPGADRLKKLEKKEYLQYEVPSSNEVCQGSENISTPCQAGTKPGRKIKIKQGDPIKSSFLPPCPPSEQVLNREHLPPIQKSVEFAHQQTPFEPHPPHTPNIRGSQASTKYGRRLKIPQGDPIKSSVLPSFPLVNPMPRMHRLLSQADD
ncbi:WD repeat-containing protein on Y chromosome-like [Centropristis striata]|uniref:WD repeat-containing protein on Y chromosome-like n=1 Tax=Centropristis striata TaxID=184440 RepID=UPI0027E10C80|nr:WD repeat-containing protein on Y chromosome-like [Centropristis striata]